MRLYFPVVKVMFVLCPRYIVKNALVQLSHFLHVKFNIFVLFPKSGRVVSNIQTRPEGDCKLLDTM